MNIKLSDLKTFQKLSGHIKASGITPSSECIKFGEGAIIKNVHHAFVSFDCVDSTENILVNEHILWSLVNATSSEFINISSKGNKTTISDGRDKIPFPFVDVKNYSELPVSKEDKKSVSPEFIIFLGRAAGACGPVTQIASWLMYVHIGDSGICAGNGYMGVCFPVEEDYKMVIEAKIASIISKYPFTQIAESEGHYFFYAEKFMMGFSKQEIGWFNLKAMLNGGTERTFSISATDLLSFNSLALSLSKEFGTTTMSTGKFEMNDTVRQICHTRPYESITLPEAFSYNAENMNKAVMALDVEDLDFYHTEKAYYIKSTETKATAIIAKIKND